MARLPSAEGAGLSSFVPQSGARAMAPPAAWTTPRIVIPTDPRLFMKQAGRAEGSAVVPCLRRLPFLACHPERSEARSAERSRRTPITAREQLGSPLTERAAPRFYRGPSTPRSSAMADNLVAQDDNITKFGMTAPSLLPSSDPNYSAAHTVFTSVYASSTSWPISRPHPDCL